MSKILRSDWLPEQVRWRYLARSGLLAVTRNKKFLQSYMINHLLAKMA